MKAITLDDCEYELTGESFEELLASGAIIEAPFEFDNTNYQLDSWHKFTYEEVCMLMKGPGDNV